MLLVDDPLQQMRQDGRHHDAQDQMICLAALTLVAGAALQKKSHSELLRQAVMKLSPDHREIIDLVYYQEKSVDDCALILGIPAATVKTRMFYARKKLAELVQLEAH
jgi:RNA polymerase sigma-70 factor, ECF subfamily